MYAYAASRVLSSARLRRPTRARIQAGAIFWNRKCIELAPDCRIERGAIVDARQGAQGAISIGPESRIASGAIVVSFTERILIGRKTNINYHSVVQGETTIGDDCLIAMHCVINAGSHTFPDRSKPMRKHHYDLRPVHIDDDVWIGAGTVVLGGVTIGRGAIIGAGAVVTRSIPEFAIAMGVPARIVRERP